MEVHTLVRGSIHDRRGIPPGAHEGSQEGRTEDRLGTQLGGKHN